MERNYPTGIKFRIFQAAVLSLSLLLASVSVAGCLLGDLAAEFPDAPQYLLQSFVTFPTIGGMIANVVGGASAAKVGKKNLCLHLKPGRLNSPHGRQVLPEPVGCLLQRHAGFCREPYQSF